MGKGIDLYHRAVGLITKIVTDFVELLDRRNDFIRRRGVPNAFAVGESEFLQQWKKIGVLLQLHSAERAGTVEDNSERTTGHQSRIKLFQ